MKIKDFLKSLFNFQLPRDFQTEEFEKSLFPENEIGTPEHYPTAGEIKFPTSKSNQEKVWIDNIFRVWISIITLFVCLGLFLSQAIPSFKPLLILFFVYAFSQVMATRGLFRTQKKRQFDFLLCGMDVACVSVAIFFTGGVESPLYFLYFIPLIIQSFHRDWALILYYGLGSVAGYAFSIMFVAQSGLGVDWANLVARVVCMLITVLAALSAVNLLRKRESKNSSRMRRMRGLTQVSQILNRISASRDLRKATEEIVAIINKDFQQSFGGWSRALLKEDSDFEMRAIMQKGEENNGLKETITVRSCPAAASNSIFDMPDAEKETGCPTESFSFQSHVCAPISGSDNEAYGVLFAGARKPNVFMDEEKGYLTFIGRALGLTIQRLRRVEELQLSLEMDSCAMATYLASTRGLDETFTRLVEGLNAILKTDQATVYLWNGEKRKLEPAKSVGPYAQQEMALTFGLGEGMIGRVFEKRMVEWTASPDFAASELKNHFPFENFICFPVQNLHGEPLGAVTAWHFAKGARFSAYEIDISSTFITRAAVAIENALLHKKAGGQKEDDEAKAA